MTHTPGPWRLGADLKRIHTDYRDEYGNAAKNNFFNGSPKTICSISHNKFAGIAEHVANGNLISEVPTLKAQNKAMLEALEGTVKNCHICGGEGSYTLMDETEICQSPGSSLQDCQFCAPARAAIKAAKEGVAA